jgi:transposase
VEEFPRYAGSMTPEEEVIALRTEVANLKQQLTQALAVIAQLRKELDKYKNEPPSFIKPTTPKPKDKAEKEPRRKRAKDQNGARRRETPTQTIQHKIEQCPHCHYPMQHPQLALRRQVIELSPPQPVEITEHQLYKSWCPRCSKWHHARVDLSTQVIGQGRMGVRIASLIAYLRTCLRLPVRLIREYLHSVHNLLISAGEIVELLHRVAETEPVQQATQQVHEHVRHSPIVHGDETVWREAGQNGYIWCFCTPQGERYYEYDKSRGGAVAKRILGAEFRGTLVSDFYAAYNDFPGEHQRCWAHLLRDLYELKEEHKENQQVVEWAGAVRKLFDTGRDALSGPSPPTQEQQEQLYVCLCEATAELARRYANAKAHRAHPCHTLAKRLLLHLDGLFQFVRQPGLSADNNLAERSVRPVVVMRKVSGGSQSERGTRTRMTLASLFTTWRAKGLSPFYQCFFLLSHPSLPQL